MGVRTPFQTVNFERSDSESDDFIIFLKHTRMVIDIDGGSHSSNARLLQFPQKKISPHDQSSQRFRLRPYHIPNSQQTIVDIPREFFR